MSIFFSELKLPDELKNYLNSDGEVMTSIDNLSKINIFVGANNSGKSRFLRELAKNNDPEFNCEEPNTKKYLEYIYFLSNGLNEIRLGPDGERIISFTAQGRKFIGAFPITDNKFINRKKDDLDFINNVNALMSNGLYRLGESRGPVNLVELEVKIRAFLNTNKEKVEFIKNFRLDSKIYKRYYLPILRSLNNFQKEIGKTNSKHDFTDFYKDRLENNYDFKDPVEVFTGQKMYFDVRGMLLGDADKRKLIADYEKFLSDEIFNKKVTLIPKEDHDVLNVKIGEVEDPIYKLGDGIQSLIMITFPIFTTERGLFFIEEPETNLHPGMQRKIFELILNSETLRNKKHQYFITTHSNHFLDMSFDYKEISIYKFSEIEGVVGQPKRVEQVSNGDESVLQELGVRKSSVFITNATIWVEGITDRLYIKKFLDLYQEKNKKERIFEDIDYSFVEYSGNNITHWSFLDSSTPTMCVDRLCGKSYLITDKDGKRKEKRQKELNIKLGKRYKCLDCREIENILSLTSIEKAIKGFAKDKDFVLSASKSFRHDDYRDCPIGTFIDKKLKPTNNKYSGASGSLDGSKKLLFCQNAIKDLSFEEMTPLAVRLAKDLYDFIFKQKGR